MTVFTRDDECPHIRRLGADGEGMDFCELTEKVSGRIHPCELVSGGECETWEEIKREWENE